jgi:hypothetical protein
MEDIYGSWGLSYSNYISHVAIVDICCGCQDHCVTLYNPHLHECFSIIFFLFDLLQTANNLDKTGLDVMHKLNTIIEGLTKLKVGEGNIGLIDVFRNFTVEAKRKHSEKK